jgi:hypothetical protein
MDISGPWLRLGRNSATHLIQLGSWMSVHGGVVVLIKIIGLHIYTIRVEQIENNFHPLVESEPFVRAFSPDST